VNDVRHFCRAMLCVSAAYAVVRCPSVCPSVTFVYCRNVQTYLQNFFTILLFP